MSYLFIAPVPGSASRRHVDFNDIAALFSEYEREHVGRSAPGALSRVTQAARLLLAPVDACLTRVAKALDTPKRWPLQWHHLSDKPSLSSQRDRASDRSQKSAAFASDALGKTDPGAGHRRHDAPIPREWRPAPDRFDPRRLFSA